MPNFLKTETKENLRVITVYNYLEIRKTVREYTFAKCSYHKVILRKELLGSEIKQEGKIVYTILPAPLLQEHLSVGQYRVFSGTNKHLF